MTSVTKLPYLLVALSCRYSYREASSKYHFIMSNISCKVYLCVLVKKMRNCIMIDGFKEEEYCFSVCVVFFLIWRIYSSANND